MLGNFFVARSAERNSAMYFISARGKNGSLVVSAAGAADAMTKLGAFEANGMRVTVLDGAGRERSVEELQHAANDANRKWQEAS